MSYGINLGASAQRHWYSAEALYNVTLPSQALGSCAVAGYLFGLTGELAIKEIMRGSGYKELPASERRRDPYFAHFPALKTLLRDNLRGRRSGYLKTVVENPALFAEWDTQMRYAPTADIKKPWVDKWRVSAKELVDRMYV